METQLCSMTGHISHDTSDLEPPSYSLHHIALPPPYDNESPPDYKEHSDYFPPKYSSGDPGPSNRHNDFNNNSVNVQDAGMVRLLPTIIHQRETCEDEHNQTRQPFIIPRR